MPTVQDITNEVEGSKGTGIFDVLITAVELRIEDQFNKNRLVGTDYANVYLGSMQAILQQSIIFILGKDKVDSEVTLLQTQDSETLLNGIEDRLVKSAQVSKLDSEKALLLQKKVTEYFQTAKATATGTTATANSPVANQAALLAQQSKSLKWNADQKYMHSILSTSVANAGVTGTSLDSTAITTAIDANGNPVGSLAFIGSTANDTLNKVVDNFKPV